MNGPISTSVACDVPPVRARPKDRPATGEMKRFDHRILDYKIKRAGTFGGLGVAGVLYVVGIVVVLKVLAIWPFSCSPVTEMTETLIRIVGCATPDRGENLFQGLTGVMLALFSVPTILLIAVLRSASPKSDPLPDSVYAAVSDKLASALERLINAKR